MRPENLLEAIGIDFRGLNDEERAMQGLLVEEYKKKGRNLIREIKEWREKNPQATLGEAIRALFEQEK
jgi:hypothetical protein